MASLEPVGRVSEIGLVAVLNPHAIEGVNSLETLLTFGRKNPGKLTFASSGIGTTSHLAGMLFSLRTGIEMLHIPYRGGNAAMMDVLAGRIPFMIDVAPNTLTFAPGNLKRWAAPHQTVWLQRRIFPRWPNAVWSAWSSLPGTASHSLRELLQSW